LIIDVTKDGPADKAGLIGSDKTLAVPGGELQIGGDVVTAIEGQPVHTMDDLISYLIQHTHPGDTVSLDVIRAGGNQETVSVTLGVRPSAEELSQAEEK
jgi:S1-C subfamily serine protease